MLRSLVVIFLIVLSLLVGLVPISIAHMLRLKTLRNRMTQQLIRWLLALCRVRVSHVGQLSAVRPLLLVSNHLSYLDVWVLGSIGGIRFAPKAEIARWPLIGWCCKLMDCVFIDRRPQKTKQSQQALAQAFTGDSVVAVFPEATTGDGRVLLPFKPALFEAAGVAIQPVAIRYRLVAGVPMNEQLWPKIAWYGDMTLLPHLFTLLNLGKIEVELHFLPIIQSIAGEGRKELAQRAHASVASALTVH